MTDATAARPEHDDVRPDEPAAIHPADLPERPGLIGMAARFTVVAIVAGSSLAATLVSSTAVTLTRGRASGRAHRYRQIRRLIERLGPTYVKFGQIMSSRRDALPGGMCDELCRLHDTVRPIGRRTAERMLDRIYGERRGDVFSRIDLLPVASGSIACVYRAQLRDGRDVAVKLRRPHIASRMAADLAIMQAFATLAQRFPKCKGMPIGELTDYLSVAILGQLDLSHEAANLEHLAQCLRDVDGVRVPRVVRDASRSGCLVMEFFQDLDAANVRAHSDEVRAELARTALSAAGELLFEHGFVHCDLHPGNMYVTPSGDIVILDAGFSARVPSEVRALMGEFFMRMSLGHGLRCGQIILESAAEIRSDLDTDAFMAAVAALVDAKAGPTTPDFTMMDFGNDLFDLQRDFGLYAKSDFAFPLMSLGTIEGTVRTIDPAVDFQDVGRARAKPRLVPSPPHPEPADRSIAS